MTPNRAVILEKCTNRTDFSRFTVELQAMRWPSNYVKFTTTNDVLKMDDFIAMPPGLCVMGVKSTCADGEESAISLFKLDIRRDAPAAPKAHVVSTGAPVFRNSLSNSIRIRRTISFENPPTMDGSVMTNIISSEPLPNGKPETYSDGVLKMQKFYAEHQGRRNQ